MENELPTRSCSGRARLLLCVLLLCPLSVRAQSGAGTLRVQVTDPSGSAVPAASLKLANQAAAAQSARTDLQGLTVFRNLAPGVYSIEAAAKGFAPYQLKNYEIVAGRIQDLNIPLALATTTEHLTVNDYAKVDVDPSNNAGALVLRKSELEALSDDRTDLAVDLQALAGPAAGPNGGANSIYLYETSGLYSQNQIITNLNARVSAKFTLSGFYAWGRANSNSDGAGTFPANQYDLSTEYGRAGFDVRHRVQLNGSISMAWGMRLSPFLTVASGRPYNVTVGRDLNGDSLYLDRPAFATDLARSSVAATSIGAFDTAPLPGQTIIPRNYGQGPGMVAANLRFAKTFTFGERAAPGKKPSSDPRQLTLMVNARNLINHPNLGNPNGNLSSPVFGRSTGLMGGGQGGIRRIDVKLQFDF